MLIEDKALHVKKVNWTEMQNRILQYKNTRIKNKNKRQFKTKCGTRLAKNKLRQN